MNESIIRNTPSGPIQMVFKKSRLYIEFNCECQHALEYCKAVCCKCRPEYNVDVTPKESDNYKSFEQNGLNVLQHLNGACVYLNNEDRCSIHIDKPSTCKEWHCSPKGKGTGIRHFGEGWVLRPFTREEEVCSVNI